MKLAGSVSFGGFGTNDERLTVGSAVHHNKACVNIGCLVSFSELDGVCVTSNSIFCLEYVHLVVGALKSPQCGNAATATANNSNLHLGS